MTAYLIPKSARRDLHGLELQAGSWGDEATHAVCMMSGLVPGAHSVDDCVTAGWPRWLAALNVTLFDANVGAFDEDAARRWFAYDVAKACTVPVDYDKARDLFLIKRLDTGKHSALATLRSIDGDWQQQIKAVDAVVALLYRRAAGEDVAEEMKAARAAARAGAYSASAASYAASYAADAAAYAASYATDAASYAASEAAAYAAKAAAYAAEAATYAAVQSAARADLLKSLREARP